MAGPPGLLRDSRLDLVTLSALAREFDAISRTDGRTWPATDFVRWLHDEWRSSEEDLRPTTLHHKAAR